MRTSVLLILLPSFLFANVALAESWKIGCSAGYCVALDGSGRLKFLDLNHDKPIVFGTASDQLEKAAEKASYSISCTGTYGMLAGDFAEIAEECAIVDDDGRIWVGSPRKSNFTLLGAKLTDKTDSTPMISIHNAYGQRD
jgi:hypothetical protein